MAEKFRSDSELSMGPAGGVKSVLYKVKAIIQWSNKWLAHIWLGLPLMVGCVTMIHQTSQNLNASIYDVALVAPRFVREGVITRPDLRGRKLLFTMNSGESRPIHCWLVQSESSCLFGKDFPMAARVMFFEHKVDGYAYWIIARVEDSNGRILRSEKDQMGSLQYRQNVALKQGYAGAFFEGVFIAYFLFVPVGLMIAIPGRWFKRRRAARGEI